MWAIAGFLIAAAIGLPAVFIICRRGSAHFENHPWVLHDTAELHVHVLGGLAGFAFTGVVLIVTFARERAGVVDPALDNVTAMFLTAFLWWIGGAFLISYIPHKETSGDLMPRIHFSLATHLEYRTVFLSWFALLPLLEANGLGRLAPILYFLLPASLLCGSVLVAMATDGLGLLRFWETYASAAVGVALTLAYAAIVTFGIPGARSAYSPLQLGLAIFCLNGGGFALAALTPLAPRYAGVRRFFERHARRIVIADMQLTMLSLGFLWMAVVGVI